jgi:hypothetical protein
MKKVILFLVLVIFTQTYVRAQSYKNDTRPQFLKEDDLNVYKSDNISTLDIIQALDFLGVRISKFSIGKFDKKYNLCIMVDEHLGGKIIKTDTIYCGDNEYKFPELGISKLSVNYIDQIKIFTRIEKDKIVLLVDTYKRPDQIEIKYHKTDEKQFFMLRNYLNPIWKLNKKIPLMIYASSWKDGEGQRFCGTMNLSENDELTNELLSLTPNYFLVSYIVTDIDMK